MSNSNTDDFDCNICEGDGYEYEQVEDKREKRPCPRPDCQKKLADSKKEKNEQKEAIDVITDKLEKKEGRLSSLPDIEPISIKLASVAPVLEELEGMAQAIETLSADLKAYRMEKSGYADEQDAIARRKLND